jgi:hypothetical protein
MMPAMIDKFASERVCVGRGDPVTEGDYVCEVYFGWKVLTRHKGEWWHTQLVGKWTATAPVRWIGPLPALDAKPKPQPKQEFDL